jgi:hypothetical protein
MRSQGVTDGVTVADSCCSRCQDWLAYLAAQLILLTATHQTLIEVIDGAKCRLLCTAALNHRFASNLSSASTEIGSMVIVIWTQ